MKGFIEVTHPDGNKRAVNISIIESFISEAVVIASGHYSVKETYSEIKALIEEAQKEDEPSFVITSNKCGFEMPDGTFRGFRNEETQQ